MRTHRRWTFVIAAWIAVMALLVAACGGGEGETSADDSPTEPAAEETTAAEETATDEAAADDEEPLVIGWSAPYSGPAASLGPFVGAGAEIALEEMNHEFDGRPVEFITYDDKDDPAAAISVAQQAIEQDDVTVMIGPAQSRTALATLDTYAAAGVPQFMTGATMEVVSPEYPRVFRMMYNTRQQAQLHVQYAVESLGIENIGLFVVDDALGDSNIKEWTDELATYDLEPVASVAMPPGDTDATGLVSELQDAGAEAVLAYANGADGAVMVRGMNDIGFDVPVVGHAGFALSGFRDLVEDVDTSNVYSTFFCSFTGSDLSSRVEDFIGKAKEQVYDGGDFVEGAAYQGLTYDIVYAIREGYRNAGGTTDRDALYEGLKQVSSYDGLMGPVNLADDNEGWSLENITIVKADSYDPETGTFPEFAPEATCGAQQ